MSLLKDRAQSAARHYKMSLVKWQETLGLSAGHFYNTTTISRKVAKAIEEMYPEKYRNTTKKKIVILISKSA